MPKTSRLRFEEREARTRERTRLRTEERLAAGRCQQCGAERSDPKATSRMCAVCAENLRAWRRERYRKRVEEGVATIARDVPWDRERADAPACQTCGSRNVGRELALV